MRTVSAPSRLDRAANRLRPAWVAAAFAAAALFPQAAGSAQDTTPAKLLFGKAAIPTAEQPRPIGSYAQGCLAGAVELPHDGTGFQTVRPSRNREWGTPQLISFIQKLGADAPKLGWRGLLIGDMSQPRGGPMASGHDSHQTGLDVDVWHLPMPDHTMTAQEREDIVPISVLKPGKLEVDPAKYEESYTRLLKQAASYPEVERIFVSAAIKKLLCDSVGPDRAWLRKLRPWGGHDDHFHVRLLCPPGQAGCVPQDPPPPGDDCGANLAYWFEYHPPPKNPPPPSPPATMASLPAACTTVLQAEPGGVTELTPLPRPRPR